MRKLLSALVLILGLAAAPVAAHATPVTYNLTLTSYSGALGGNVSGGTGSLTVDSAPGAGLDTFTGSQITDLLINIAGNTFTLADATSNTSASFFNGNLLSLAYSSVQSLSFHLESGLLVYNFRDGFGRNGQWSNGTISATEQITPAPEPSSLLLFGTGALAFGLIGFRKFAA